MAAASGVPPVIPVITSGARSPLADELGAEVDLVERELGERLVDEVDVLEERGLGEVGAPGRDHLDVVRLGA